jgi:hypothetical protein
VLVANKALTKPEHDTQWYRSCFLSVLVREYPAQLQPLLGLLPEYLEWETEVKRLREECPHRSVVTYLSKTELTAYCGCGKTATHTATVEALTTWQKTLNLSDYQWLKQLILEKLNGSKHYTNPTDALRFFLENPHERVSHYGQERFVFPALNLEPWNYDHWDSMWKSYKEAALLYWKDKGFLETGKHKEIEQHLKWCCWMAVEDLSDQDCADKEYNKTGKVYTRQGVSKPVKKLRDILNDNSK